jgi:hypothetical protein
VGVTVRWNTSSRRSRFRNTPEGRSHDDGCSVTHAAACSIKTCEIGSSAV